MANVVNRITKEIMLCVNTPDYPVEDWLINPPSLDDVANLGPEYFNIVGDDVVLKTESERNALDLNREKSRRFREIDVRTDDLIAAGFSYGGMTLSASIYAQARWTAGNVERNLLTYPITVNDLADSGTYDIVDADDFHNLYLTAIATNKYHLDTGTALKNQIRDAATMAELDAVVDDR